MGPYGHSKVATEALVQRGPVPWTIVQPSITYGPGDTNGMIEYFIRPMSGIRSAITRGDRASKQSNPVANGARSMKVSSGIGEVRCAGQPLILSTG